MRPFFTFSFSVLYEATQLQQRKKKPFSYPLNSWKQEDAVCFPQDGNSALFDKGGIRSCGILLAITRVGDRESCPAMLRAGDKHLDTPGGQEPVQRSFVRMPPRYHEISLGQALEEVSPDRFWMHLIQPSCHRFTVWKTVVTP